MLASEIDGKDFRRAMKMLRETDPELVKQLRADMRQDIKPYAQMVQEAEPKAEDLPSGFMHGYSKTRWEPSKVTVSFTPGMARKRKGWTNLIALSAGAKNGTRGYAIVELAGTRSAGVTPQGRFLVGWLKTSFTNPNPIGGRFFWKKFYSLKPEIVALAENSVQNFINAFNRKI